MIASTVALRFGSLFAGIGGIDLGLERAGMECAWQVEIDEFCNEVLARHWPDVPRHRDIHKIGAGELEAVDLICGGFPCQPVSLAGRREAQADPRWLWPEFARVVSELRPRYVLVENVPGLYTAGGSEVLADLASLGYDAEWDAIPAAAFGAPHLRYRVFIVAYSNGANLRQQPRRRDGEGRTSQAFLGNAGKEESSADVGSAGQQDDQGVAGSTGQRRRSVFVADIDGEQTERATVSREKRLSWPPEPRVERVVHGVPCAMDRNRALGNAVVPQVAEWIGRRILAVSD